MEAEKKMERERREEEKRKEREKKELERLQAEKEKQQAEEERVINAETHASGADWLVLHNSCVLEKEKRKACGGFQKLFPEPRQTGVRQKSNPIYGSCGGDGRASCFLCFQTPERIGIFVPFQPKRDMLLAPIHRKKLSPKRRAAFEDAVAGQVCVVSAVRRYFDFSFSLSLDM